MPCLNMDLYTACWAAVLKQIACQHLAATTGYDVCSALLLSNQDIVCIHGFLHQVQSVFALSR